MHLHIVDVCAKFLLFNIFNFKGAEQLSCRFPVLRKRAVERNNPNLLHDEIRPKYIPARSPKHSISVFGVYFKIPPECPLNSLARNSETNIYIHMLDICAM